MAPGAYVVLMGHVSVVERDGLGRVTPIVDHGPGQFGGEVVQLSGRASLVDAIAEGEVEALLLCSASEGLSVAVIDTRAYGGQAGASARIENYLGFPTGISGQALAARAFLQAQKFGAEILIPASAKTLDCARVEGTLSVDIDNGARVRARAAVIASGARYRRPAIPEIGRFEGRGVWYWASPIEARLCAGEEVIVVGGGNSAGQGAVFPVRARRQGAHDSARPRAGGEHVAIPHRPDRGDAEHRTQTETEIIALDGAPDGGVEKVRWRDRRNGEESEAPIRNVFLFIGADPATEWLSGCGVEVDKAGFVVTGARCSQGAAPTPMQSSVPGVFAVGDVRSGSVKRVGGAIGEGAAVVAAIHGFLAHAAGPHL